MKTAIAIACALTLTACASVPSAPGADTVRTITPAQATVCRMLVPVQFVDLQFATVGKTPWLWEKLTTQGIHNATVAAGGNAVVVTKDESNWFMGTFAVQGDAYRCAA